MRGLFVLALCACGRLHFDAVGGDGDGSVGGSGDGAGATSDAFVRGDVLISNNIAFVSEPVVVLGTLGSVQAADAICQSEAETANLPGTYVAWLSTSMLNAIDRLAGSRGWVRVDGMPFVDTVADLAAGNLYAPLHLDANGAALPPRTPVFTGTLPDGTADPFTCSDLMSTANLMAYGYANMTSGQWTRTDASFMACDQSVRIYCFGTGTMAPIVISQVSSRRAFVSDPWVPGSGIADADTRCQQSAAAAGLANPTGFRALLATTATTAASRFVDGLPWARLDGLLIAPTAQAVLDGNWEVPIALDANAVHMTDVGPSWVGANTFTTPGTSTCSDWSVSNNGSMGLGLSYNVIPPSSAAQSPPCGNANRLFCLEQ